MALWQGSTLLGRIAPLCRPALRHAQVVAAIGSSPRFVSQTASATAGPPPSGPVRLAHRPPWKNPDTTNAACFNQQYPTEYRSSMIEGAGMGWWAKVDIPAGVLIRTSSVEDGSFVRFANEDELRKTGWEISEAVHYGISLKPDPGALYFSNPGIPCNHADPSRTPSVEYRLVKPGLMEVRTLKDIKAGEEILTDYTKSFFECDWYEQLAHEYGLVSVNKIGHLINDQHPSKTE